MASYYFSSSTGKNTAAGGTGTLANPWANFWEEKSSASALSPDDICYFKAGDTWSVGNAYVNIDSNGTSGHKIIFNRYGLGNDPIFTTSSIQTTWTLHSGAIYKKTGLFNGAYTVGIDGTYALGQWNSGSATNLNLPAGSYRNEGGTIYIRLSDDSNPSGHTIYIPSSYQFDQNRGVFRGSSTRGSFLSINHMKVMYCNGIGFSFSQPDSNWYDCTSVGNGQDGFTFTGYAPNGEAATRCRAYRCYASYNNAFGNGKGQAYTTGAAYTWYINCTAEYNFKEGFDFLDYGTDTDVHNGGAVYCTSNSNNQDPSAYFGGAGFYIDGAHDMLIYGCVAHGAGTAANAQLSNNIGVSTEHQIQPVYNIHIVNCLLYDSNSYNLQISNGGDYPNYNNAPLTYGNTIVNNTFVRGSAGYGANLLVGGLGSSVKTLIKNNIFLRTAGGYNDFIWIGGLTSLVADMDYNCFYDVNKSTIFADAESTPSYTLAQWVTNRGLDTHSIQSDPKLISTTFATLDAHLTVATTPCINAGVNSPWTPPQWVIDAAVLADNGAVVGTTRPDGVVDSGTLDIGYHYYAPTPTGTLTSTNVEPATLYVNTANNVTVTFTTATAWPLDGKLVITFPNSLGSGFTFSSGGTTAATFNSGGSGSLAVATSGSIMTLTRSGGSAIAASQAVSINLSHILNPTVVGSTGVYQLKTTTSADAAIDIDAAVSADQIIAAPAEFVTITISGVKMSQIKINS